MNRLAMLVVVCTATTAAAQPTSKSRADATAAYKDGQRRYVDEDYVGAAAQFEAAYKLDPDPVYLFNIAQAYRLAKDCDKALAYYKQFLAAAPKAPNVDAVNKYIAELEATCPQPQPAPSSPPPVASGEPQTQEPAELPPSPPAQPSHLQRNLGIGALGVGAIGVTMGIVYTFKVRSDERERENLCPAPCSWTIDDTNREAELKQRGDRHSKLMVASYTVGGAAIVAGAILLLTSRDKTESGVAIVPTQGGAFFTFTARH